MAETQPVKIFIIYYSMYGHIRKLAEAIKEGAKKVDGVEIEIFQTPETLSDEILAKMHAPPKADHPTIDTARLPEADGFLLGFPTRYGMMSAQFKAFWDATGQLWAKGALVGKPVSSFVSTATLHGGQETTHLTAVSQYVHHGMPFVPIGYSHPKLQDMTEIHGGSPWGSSTLAGGDGSRQPTEIDLEIARHQGEYFANFVKALTVGKRVLAAQKKE